MDKTIEHVISTNNWHLDECRLNIGPRGGRTVVCRRVRRNGATKLWKTRPDEFRVPTVEGLKGYGEINEGNVSRVHRADECSIEEFRNA